MEAKMENSNGVFERNGINPTCNIPFNWVLENKVIGDNKEVATVQLYLGQDAESFLIYYKGGRVAGHAATPPDVFADVTVNGTVKPTLLVPGATTSFNGTKIALRTAHGQSHAEGTATLLQVQEKTNP